MIRICTRNWWISVFMFFFPPAWELLLFSISWRYFFLLPACLPSLKQSAFCRWLWSASYLIAERNKKNSRVRKWFMKGNWHQSLSAVSSSFISWPIVMKEMQFDQPPYQTSFQYFMLQNHKVLFHRTKFFLETD